MTGDLERQKSAGDPRERPSVRSQDQALVWSEANKACLPPKVLLLWAFRRAQPRMAYRLLLSRSFCPSTTLLDFTTPAPARHTSHSSLHNTLVRASLHLPSTLLSASVPITRTCTVC